MFAFSILRHHRLLNSAVLILLVLCFAVSTTAVTAHGQDQYPTPEQPDDPYAAQPAPIQFNPLLPINHGLGQGCIGNTTQPRTEEQVGGRLQVAVVLQPALNTTQPHAKEQVGGRLILRVPFVVGMGENEWAVVQWQDKQGAWHDVDGWRSHLGSSHLISWWVAPKDAGTGPFRWLVYTNASDQQILWTSTPFFLPGRGEEVTIDSELVSGYVR